MGNTWDRWRKGQAQMKQFRFRVLWREIAARVLDCLQKRDHLTCETIWRWMPTNNQNWVADITTAAVCLYGWALVRTHGVQETLSQMWASKTSYVFQTLIQRYDILILYFPVIINVSTFPPLATNLRPLSQKVHDSSNHASWQPARLNHHSICFY